MKGSMIRLGIGVFLIVLPFLELILLVKLTHGIGFLWTVVLMLAIATAGGMLVAQQSASSFRQALESANRGQAPEGAVLDGVLLMLAGILLIVPGLITDAFALVLLVPPVRRWIGSQMMSGLIRTASAPDPFEKKQRGPDPGASRGPFASGPAKSSDGPIIEGEFERLDERPRRPGTRDDR
jgi:UPF0716 protein FxsA